MAIPGPYYGVFTGEIATVGIYSVSGRSLSPFWKYTISYSAGVGPLTLGFNTEYGPQGRPVDTDFFVGDALKVPLEDAGIDVFNITATSDGLLIDIAGLEVKFRDVNDLIDFGLNPTVAAAAATVLEQMKDLAEAGNNPIDDPLISEGLPGFPSIEDFDAKFVEPASYTIVDEPNYTEWLTVFGENEIWWDVSFSSNVIRRSVLVQDLNRPLFAGDPEVRILGYGKEQMWKQIFT